MELSEIIENAVAQAVAARGASLEHSCSAPPARLADISPEPFTVPQESKETSDMLTGQDLAVIIARDANRNSPVRLAEQVVSPEYAEGGADHENPVGSSENNQPLGSVAGLADTEYTLETSNSDQCEVEVSADSSLANPLGPLKALARRSYVPSLAESTSGVTPYNPLDFYADVRFVPVMAARGVFQILQLSPALRETNIIQSHTLISHGTFSHTWSLLPLGDSLARTNTIIRPVAVLQTYGKGIPVADAVIRDYSYAWHAQAVHLRHYIDSWAVSGTHAAFQVCKDYIFEWKPIEFPQGSGTLELYLWRHNIETGSISPAARISASSPVKSPFDDSELWSLEVDVDKLQPHIALLTSFAIKLPSAVVHSWFASKKMVVPLPMPLVNFAFQDDGHVYQRLEKFYGDWEDSRIRHLQESVSSPSSESSSDSASPSNISKVQVFKRDFVEQYMFPPKAMELLNAEVKNYLEAVKAKYGIL